MSVKRTKSFVRRHGSRCCYCDANVALAPPNAANRASRDHDIPLCRGGAKSGKNVVLSCAPCNWGKNHMTGDEFRLFISTGQLAATYIEWVRIELRQKLSHIAIPSKQSV
jgi:hypothetical protein